MAEQVVRNRNGGRGMGVDSRGGPVVDPTENVIALIESSSKRQDDLRELSQQLNDERYTHIEQIGSMREQYQNSLRVAEAARLDSIRQVDREDVNKTAAAQLVALQALAAQQGTTAETLRTQVATTASAQALTLGNITAEIGKRLSSLELALSEGKGKQTVVDPQIEKLTNLVEQLARAQATVTGKSEGFSTGWAMLGSAVVLLVGLLAIASFFLSNLK